MRFKPSDLERLAMERGATSLFELIKYHYKSEPDKLDRLHRAYARHCAALYLALERRFPRTDAAQVKSRRRK
jgi:hypothetical protein